MSSPRREEALRAAAARPGWECIVSEGMVHHYPVGDVVKHSPDARCECRPRRERGVREAQVEGGYWVPVRGVLWHNAWDGRDLVAECEEGVL